MLECVINVSEGRHREVVARLAAAAGRCLLDRHSDADHNRSVLTLCGPVPEVEEAARAVAAAVIGTVDLRAHDGVHPRIGALDVVPFVALSHGQGGLVDGDIAASVAARDRFADWAGASLRLPCFLYGPERSLPDVRRQAWRTAVPDTGPARAHPTAGAAAVGARPMLVAYNLWLAPAAGVDLAAARRVAAAIRRPGLRALGLAVGDGYQVSCNLVDPFHLGPGTAYDLVAAHLRVERAELVGLAPAAVIEAEPPERRPQLGLSTSDTIEARLEQAGLDGGRF